MTGRGRESRIATLTALAALVIAFVVVAFSLPIDDFWLSIASGRAILHGANPAQAIQLTWMPTLPGALNPQWGSELILGAGNSLAWALAFNAALLACGLGLTLWRMGTRASSSAVAVAGLLVLAVLAVHLLARAQSFSIALFPLSLLLLERLRGRWWLPIAFGAMIAAWANLHGAFVIGQLAAGCWFLGTAWDERRRAFADRRSALLYGLTFAASVVAPLLNPAGPGLLSYAYGQGASDLVRQISVEWQPSWPWEPVGLLFWLLAAAIVAARIIRRPGAGMSDLLLLLATGVLAASAIRHIPWFVLTAAPVLAEDIDRMLTAAPRLGRAVGTPAHWLGGGRVRIVLIGATTVAIALQVARPSLPSSVSRLTPDAPLTAAVTLRYAASPHARVLNEQVWGGYLDWALDGKVITAMDGRIEIRSRETWSSYFALMSGDGDPARQLADARVTWALVFPTRMTLVSKLVSAGWRVVLSTNSELLLHSS